VSLKRTSPSIAGGPWGRQQAAAAVRHKQNEDDARRISGGPMPSQATRAIEPEKDQRQSSSGSVEQSGHRDAPAADGGAGIAGVSEERRGTDAPSAVRAEPIVFRLLPAQFVYLLDVLGKQSDAIAAVIIDALKQSIGPNSDESGDGVQLCLELTGTSGDKGQVSRQWSWMRACSRGSSHVKNGIPCQDFAACLEISQRDATALIAVVSDGAGSAQFASDGSRAVVQTMVRRLARFVREASEPLVITEDLARRWLHEVRDQIAGIARSKEARPRDFAATLVAVVVLPASITVCHVGDGACAGRRQGRQNWEVVSWPAQGEYASTTFFVTDKEICLRLTHLDGEFDEIAVFSDGLERLALDFSNSTAFNRFFDPLSAPLSTVPAGHHRALSAQLTTFLDSPQVIQRTNDDKTLIVARRNGIKA
jgi:hypothetical protein